MATIACVLHASPFYNKSAKTTVRFNEKQVVWLKKQVQTHCTIPHRFVCLTNLNGIDGVETIKLKHNWPGWWSKIEMFSNFDECFYIDLDTVIVGNIDHIVSHPHTFTVLDNISRPGCGRIGSGLMAWRQDKSDLYRAFKSNPMKWMNKYITAHRWGDQGFIQDRVKSYDTFQTLFPGEIVSYKREVEGFDAPPSKAKIVIFSGKTKPWDVAGSWVPAC
jgi:hypothetical protein